LALHGDLLYVADGTAGLLILDVSAPALPVQVGSFASSSMTNDVAVAGRHAFLADNATGLVALDVSDPSAPIMTDVCDTPGLALAVSGARAYVADGPGGLAIFDIQDPAAITEMSTMSFPGGDAVSVAIAGGYAVVATTDSLYTVDVSSGTLPVILARDGTGGVQRWDIVPGPTPAYPMNLSGITDAESLDLASKYLVVRQPDDPIVQVRLDLAATDSVHVEIINSNQTILRQNEWVRLPEPRIDPAWSAEFVWTGHGHDPVMSSLGLDYRTTRPYLDTVEDIPGDQGRQVRLRWQRSGFDFPGEETPITQYAVYRRYAGKAAVAEETLRGLDPVVRTDAMNKSTRNWEFVTTVPVRNDDMYATVVPTLADSTIAHGQAWSVFMVTALTEIPGVFYDSPPDSGYSVDNLAPGAPVGFSVAYGASGCDLSWMESEDEDFRYFNIYRGTTADFMPSPENLVESLAETSWSDADGGPGSYYRLTAVDFSGNESEAATSSVTSGVDPARGPTRLLLREAAPNPFNPMTKILYEVPPGAGRVRLEIYDPRGQLVARLVDGDLPPGTGEAVWHGQDLSGRAAPSGLYFIRLAADGVLLTKKISLIR